MLRKMTFSIVALLLLTITATAADKAIKVLIITGDHGHAWKDTTPVLKEILANAGMEVAVTETPSKDLTDDNLSKFDALVLNYKDTKKGGPETMWSDANKKAFSDAVRGGKGLVVYHHASSAFVGGDDYSKEFEKIISGGWRKQGNHGKKHEFGLTVRKDDHPITKGLVAEFPHANDELYQNSVMFPDSVTLVTAFSDKKIDPKNTDKHEAVVWVAQYGKGRVFYSALGHASATWDNPDVYHMYFEALKWSLGLTDADVSPRPLK